MDIYFQIFLKLYIPLINVYFREAYSVSLLACHFYDIYFLS